MPSKKRRQKDVLTYKELFGKRVKVVSSLDPGLRDLEGVFWDETSNMIVLKTPRGPVKMHKKNVILQVIGSERPIKYEQIRGRPHERVKIRVNR